MQELSKGLDLIRMPAAWWPELKRKSLKNGLNGWWVRGFSIQATKRCTACKRYKTTNAYDRERAQCSQCWKRGDTEATHAPGAVWQDGVLFRTALPDLLEVEGDTPLIPGAIRDCLKYMLGLYTQCSKGSRVRPEVKKAAKLLEKAEAQKDQKSAKKAKISVKDLREMRSGMQSFFLPSPSQPQPQPQQEFT
jgi:hypothetical protein